MLPDRSARGLQNGEDMVCEFDRHSPGFHRLPLAAIKDHELLDEKKVEEGPKTA